MSSCNDCIEIKKLKIKAIYVMKLIVIIDIIGEKLTN